MTVVKKETQAERIAAALLEIKPNVTKLDKDFAVNKLESTEATISRYLNGTGVDADFAASLLLIFRSRIEQREKLIKETA